MVSDRRSRSVWISTVPGAAAHRTGAGEDVVRRTGGVRPGLHAGPRSSSPSGQRRQEDEQPGVVRCMVVSPQSTRGHGDLQGNHRRKNPCK